MELPFEAITIKLEVDLDNPLEKVEVTVFDHELDEKAIIKKLKENTKKNLTTKSDGLQNIEMSEKLVLAHQESEVLKKIKKNLLIAEGAHHNLAKPVDSEVIFICSWIPALNTNMVELENAPTDFSSHLQYSNDHNFQRTVFGKQYTAPTFIATEILSFLLCHGCLPELSDRIAC